MDGKVVLYELDFRKGPGDRKMLTIRSVSQRHFFVKLQSSFVSCAGKKYHMSPRPQIELIAYVHAA